MSLQKVRSKVFETKKEAVVWAKEQKEAFGPGAQVKWETNRLTETGAKIKWQAVIYKDV